MMPNNPDLKMAVEVARELSDFCDKTNLQRNNEQMTSLQTLIAIATAKIEGRLLTKEEWEETKCK
jgi:hypothetical protein